MKDEDVLFIHIHNMLWQAISKENCCAMTMTMNTLAWMINLMPA